jgi:hypothetical protein
LFNPLAVFFYLHTGSGFISSDYYLHGFFSASIKLPRDYTAGVVVAFYVSAFSNPPRISSSFAVNQSLAYPSIDCRRSFLSNRWVSAPSMVTWRVGFTHQLLLLILKRKNHGNLHTPCPGWLAVVAQAGQATGRATWACSCLDSGGHKRLRRLLPRNKCCLAIVNPSHALSTIRIHHPHLNKLNTLAVAD